MNSSSYALLAKIEIKCINSKCRHYIAPERIDKNLNVIKINFYPWFCNECIEKLDIFTRLNLTVQRGCI